MRSSRCRMGGFPIQLSPVGEVFARIGEEAGYVDARIHHVYGTWRPRSPSLNIYSTVRPEDAFSEKDQHAPKSITFPLKLGKNLAYRA